MTFTSPLLITIRSTEDGYYHWELRDGPDGILEASGISPLLERCIEDLLKTRVTLAKDLTSDPHTLLNLLAHNTPDPAPIAQVHTPPGNALPAQQDIPAAPHSLEPSNSFYPHPSKSG